MVNEETLLKAIAVYEAEPDFIIPYIHMDDEQQEKMHSYFMEHPDFYDLDALSLKWYRKYNIRKQ